MKEIEKLKGKLTLMIRAKYPILQIETYEEDRAINLISKIAEETDRSIYCWSITKGLIDREKKTVGSLESSPVEVLSYIMKKAETDQANDKDGEKAIFILKDLHKFIEAPEVTRYLRDLHFILKGQYKTIILITPHGIIPQDLEKSITVLDLPYPTKKELQEMLQKTIGDLKNRSDLDTEVDNSDVILLLEKQIEAIGYDKIAEAGLGLTFNEFENVTFQCISAHEFSLKTINSEKKQIIKKSGSLEYFEPNEGMGNVGGLDNLKDWVRKAGKRFTPEAEAVGLEKPRGILLIGPPGTGKSLMAKVIAYTLQQPLLRLDMAGLSSKYYGETGNNVKKALDLADAVAPDVLWLDEIEKMFSTGQAGEGHEETMRAIGSVLTHIEESPYPVFRVATSNSPFNIRPELLQRFEKTFFVDLPNRKEREEIFAIHLRKISRDPKKFNIDKLSAESEGLVGREIRTIVKEALATAFDEGVELTTEHLLAEIKTITPMAEQKEVEINSMREWAKKNAIPATREQRKEKSNIRRAEV
jgi:AAA+ superfamily predicted ATPase